MGGTTRLSRGPPYLDARVALSSPRPSAGDRRGALRQWHRVGRPDVRELSRPGPGVVADLPREDLRRPPPHAGLLDQVPCDIWTKPWVVHCQHAGRGQKVLDYLGRYIFRVAIANSRLERIQDGQVTFRYRDNRTQQLRRVTLSGVEFLHR